MALIVAERSTALDSWRWLVSGVPRWLVRGIEGDIASVIVPGPPTKGRRRTRLLLGPELVLKKRLQLPFAAKGDLGPAVRLMVETETPFSPDEVLVHAERLQQAGNSEEAAYLIRIVPRAAMFAATRAQGLRPADIVAIVDKDAPDRTDFWRSAFPGRSAWRWSVALPFLVAAAALTVMVVDELGTLERQRSELGAATTDRLAQLSAAADRLEEYRQQITGGAEVSEALASSSSAYNLLGELRSALEPDTEVLRIEFAGRALSVSIRSADALATARHVATKLSAQIDGAITADPGTGLEVATLKVAQRAGDAK